MAKTATASAPAGLRARLGDDVFARLTPRQADVLAAFADYQDRHGFGPTLTEVGREVGLSKVTVMEHAQAMVRKGALRDTGESARRYLVPDLRPRAAALAEVGRILDAIPARRLDNADAELGGELQVFLPVELVRRVCGGGGAKE